MGWVGWNIALTQPGKQHSGLRGLLLKGLSPSMVISYDPMVERIAETQVLRPLARSGPGGCDPAVFIDMYVLLFLVLITVAYRRIFLTTSQGDRINPNRGRIRR